MQSKPVTPSPKTTKVNLNKPEVHCTAESCKFMCEAVVNMELLYLKAKMFHWNVRGGDFRENHLTYDEIQEVALDAADKLAERHRFLGDFVDNSTDALCACRWYPDGRPQMSLEEMKRDMVLTLDCINCHFMEGIKITDEVTSNICQDICGNIDKMNYFVRSSLVDAA